MKDLYLSGNPLGWLSIDVRVTGKNYRNVKMLQCMWRGAFDARDFNTHKMENRRPIRKFEVNVLKVILLLRILPLIVFVIITNMVQNRLTLL